MSRPYALREDDPQIAAVLHLIRDSFAFMEHRIYPPSSMHRLTEASVAAQCKAGEVWVIGDPPMACVFLAVRGDCLYLSKLAVAAQMRGQGLARRLVAHAAARARALDLPALELQTRIELTENHAAFAAMGFSKTGESTHAGYVRPTSVTMRRVVI